MFRLSLQDLFGPCSTLHTVLARLGSLVAEGLGVGRGSLHINLSHVKRIPIVVRVSKVQLHTAV